MERAKFGNGKMQDLVVIRSELATLTHAITLFLKLLSIGELARVGRYMETHGEELRDIKHTLHRVIAPAQTENHEEKSILTSYTEDDKAVWKEFRRQLIKLGVSSKVLKKFQEPIKRYAFELGKRGAFGCTARGG